MKEDFAVLCSECELQHICIPPGDWHESDWYLRAIEVK